MFVFVCSFCKRVINQVKRKVLNDALYNQGDEMKNRMNEVYS